MMTVVGVVIALVVSGLIGWMVFASSGTEGERRYCLKCGETTWWHPRRGCEHCAWCERQW